MLPLLLILYGEDDTYGESRYSVGNAANQYGGDRYGVDALLYDIDTGTDRYGAQLDGDAPYARSGSGYDQQGLYDGDNTADYGFLDLSVSYQGMYEPSYRVFAL